MISSSRVTSVGWTRSITRRVSLGYFRSVKQADFTVLTNLWFRTQTFWLNPCFLYQRHLRCHSKIWRHCPERTSVAASLTNNSTGPASVKYYKHVFWIQQIHDTEKENDNVCLEKTFSLQYFFRIYEILNLLMSCSNQWMTETLTLRSIQQKKTNQLVDNHFMLGPCTPVTMVPIEMKREIIRVASVCRWISNS